LGDLLLLRRVVAALRHAGHRVRLAAPAEGAVLVGSGASEVDEALRWDAPETARILAGERTKGPLSRALREADVVVAYTRSSDVASSFAAATRRLIALDPAPPVEGPHASVWLTRPLAELGLSEWPDPESLRFSDAERAGSVPFLGTLPERFVAVHPGSGSAAKNWPTSRFMELARRLARSSAWLLVLGPAEAQIERAHPPGAVLARSLPLRTLGALLSRAGLFVGNDSGVTHLAAAAGARTLALFGATDPLLWAPVGPGVRCLSAPGGRLDALALEHVVREADALRAGGV
jgi:heptosyltransferase III